MKRVLYVEDDPINALVLRKLLEGDFLFRHVEDGEACLDLVANEQFDIILMDINLGRGKMNGVETMRMLKQLPAYENVPVMAVTSYALPEDADRFIREGFDFYFEKPVERGPLIRQIRLMTGGVSD